MAPPTSVAPASKSKKDGLYLLSLGIAVFLLFGFISQHSAADAHEDFRAVVYGARCLLHHCDPYNEIELFRFYQHEFPEPVASHFRSHTLTLYVNLPSTILIVSPLAVLPFSIASVLWSLLTAVSLVLAALLTWDLASEYAPTLSGVLIGLCLASGATVLGNGNPAGIVIAFTVIAVWCFLRERLIVAGIICLAISLALKPHDVGLVWLCLLLMGPCLRKRALQTLAVTTFLSLTAVLWVSAVAPHWIPEFRSNLAVMSAPGGNNDPGPAGPTSRSRAPEMIVSLQSVFSLVRDSPAFYNAATYLVCGIFFLLWLTVRLRSRRSASFTLISFAVLTPLTLLVTYHRAYDARLLMLTVPACTMLYAERRTGGKIALLLTTLALIFTGELPYVFLNALTADFHPQTISPILDHSAPIVLLALAIFYTSVCVSRSSPDLTQDPNSRPAGNNGMKTAQHQP